MDEPRELRDNRNWTMAVWALRAGYAALVVAVVGLIVISTGGTPWFLAVGVVGWLVAAVVMVTGFMKARHELPGPRPGFWPVRRMLISDTVHRRHDTESS